jgi:hypothetical protein
MRIEVGQDALGRWAWIIWGTDGKCLASDDDYREAVLAMEDAAQHLRLLEQSERRKRGSGRA